MAVLVTGGTGYIGSHATVALLESGADVVIVDNYSNSKPEVLDRVERITGKRPTFYQVDLRDGRALAQVFATESIDAVIHFAALKAVGESVAKPLAYYGNNMEGTLSLLRVMAEYGVKNLVFSSSATVYGLHNQSPLTEDMPTSATNPYGQTKVMTEQILRDVVVADDSWHIVLLRYFNPIGAHESGLIGEDPNGIPNNLMPYVSQVAVGKLAELSVFGDDYDTPDGTGVRDYIHVVDLAAGHLVACDYVRQHSGVATFNLGTGIGYSVLDIVHAFERVNGVRIPYRVTPRRPGDIATCYADAQLAAQQLGWRAQKTLDDMCRDAWRWQSHNPNGYQQL